jgi:hypothetical protein
MNIMDGTVRRIIIAVTVTSIMATPRLIRATKLLISSQCVLSDD